MRINAPLFINTRLMFGKDEPKAGSAKPDDKKPTPKPNPNDGEGHFTGPAANAPPGWIAH